MSSETNGDGNGGPPRPRNKVGYKNPPNWKQFPKGKSGNPSGAKKRAKPQAPIGNRIEDAGAAFIEELVRIMFEGPPTAPYEGKYAGAKALAAAFWRDGVKREGLARRELYSLFLARRLDSDFFKPISRSQQEADHVRRLTRALIDPTITDEEWEGLLQEIRDSREDSEDPLG